MVETATKFFGHPRGAWIKGSHRVGKWRGKGHDENEEEGEEEEEERENQTRHDVFLKGGETGG